MLQGRPFLGQVRIAQQQPGWRPAVRRPRVPALAGRPGLGAAAVLTDANFDQVLRAPAAAVDFWSPSCPHCVTYKPVFEEVAGRYGDRVLMAAVNVNDAPRSAGSYNIQSIPATVFLVDGKEVGRAEGALGADELVAEMTRAFGGSLPAPGAAAPAPASAGIPAWAGILGGLAAVGLVALLVS